MKRFTCLLALILAIGLTFSTNDAEARRLGGGMSSGMQRGSGIMQRSAPTPAPGQNLSQAARPAPGATPGAAPAPAGMSRWLGPLAGIAAGVGIASLFSHFGMGGMGGGMGSMLMMLLVGGGIFLVVRMLMQRGAQPQPQPQYAGSNGGPARFEPYVVPQNGAAPPAATSAGNINVPAGFDVDGFLRQAKLNFVRLQAANDAGNMEDIRAFTTPEMFAEVQLEYQERGRTNQQTDVVQLNAALLDLSTEGARQIASVRFYGSLRENVGAAPEDFDEVWHLSRPADASSGWIIAGIQQFN